MFIDDPDIMSAFLFLYLDCVDNVSYCYWSCSKVLSENIRISTELDMRNGIQDRCRCQRNCQESSKGKQSEVITQAANQDISRNINIHLQVMSPITAYSSFQCLYYPVI